MSTQKPRETSVYWHQEVDVGGPKPTQTTSILHKKITEQLRSKKSGAGKNTATYWKDRIFKKVSRGVESPHYTMDLMFKGRRLSFSLGTGNQSAASLTAAGIYLDVLSNGVDAALAKHRPQTEKTETIATVGEWIAATKKVASVNDATFNQYAASLRKIVGDIITVKKDNSRFGPRKGGASKYRASIDDTSLEILTLEAIMGWRKSYVGKSKNPLEIKSKQTSCNSTIRQARSLFSGILIYTIKGLLLPTPRPFEIPVELKHAKKGSHPLFYPAANNKYSSKIDAKQLLLRASQDLEPTNPSAFLAMLLALGAGLRRGEIDSLCWHQIDTQGGFISMEVTEKAGLKTRSSEGLVEIDEKLAGILQGYKARTKAKPGDYVIEPNVTSSLNSGPKVWGQHYRANATFDTLNAWLKANGVSARKPLHELRKELGSLITEKYGIHAASQMLRHSSIQVTANHYAAKKSRTTVAIGSWLTPDDVTPMPEQRQTEPQESRAG